MSAPVSKRVLRACRAVQISGHSNRIPDDLRAANPPRGQHDAQEGSASFSEKLQMVKIYETGLRQLELEDYSYASIRSALPNSGGSRPNYSGDRSRLLRPALPLTRTRVRQFFRQFLPLGPPFPVERGQGSTARDVTYRWQDRDRYR